MIEKIHLSKKPRLKLHVFRNIDGFRYDICERNPVYRMMVWSYLNRVDHDSMSYREKISHINLGRQKGHTTSVRNLYDVNRLTSMYISINARAARPVSKYIGGSLVLSIHQAHEGIDRQKFAGMSRDSINFIFVDNATFYSAENFAKLHELLNYINSEFDLKHVFVVG
jgi:hypothetical protein